MIFIDEDIRSFEVDAPIADALHFLTVELQSCLILLDDFVVEERLFIIREDDFFCYFCHSAVIIEEKRKNQLVNMKIYDKIL